jgi:hypothetical protein
LFTFENQTTITSTLETYIEIELVSQEALTIAEGIFQIVYDGSIFCLTTCIPSLFVHEKGHEVTCRYGSKNPISQAQWDTK